MANAVVSCSAWSQSGYVSERYVKDSDSFLSGCGGLQGHSFLGSFVACEEAFYVRFESEWNVK